MLIQFKDKENESKKKLNNLILKTNKQTNKYTHIERVKERERERDRQTPTHKQM